jgi:hypothetical protein
LAGILGISIRKRVPAVNGKKPFLNEVGAMEKKIINRLIWLGGGFFPGVFGLPAVDFGADFL